MHYSSLFAFIWLIGTTCSHALASSSDAEVQFTGRVSRANEKASLMRVRVDFDNYKFLTSGDIVKFWSEANPALQCAAEVKATGNHYMLLRVIDYDSCVSKARVRTGSFLRFNSADLEKNKELAKKLIQILLKKRLALQSRLKKSEQGLTAFDERVNAVNERYETLLEKLQLEWSNEIARIEEEKNEQYQRYKGSLARLEDLDFKIEKYKVYDDQLYEDRWSLDEKIYQSYKFAE